MCLNLFKSPLERNVPDNYPYLSTTYLHVFVVYFLRKNRGSSSWFLFIFDHINFFRINVCLNRRLSTIKYLRIFIILYNIYLLFYHSFWSFISDVDSLVKYTLVTKVFTHHHKFNTYEYFTFLQRAF